nr:Hsp20/alpha crystallin family protein [Desulfobacterales bacterium]
MAEKTVPVTTEQKSPVTREETRSSDRYIVPPVDIYETSEGLTVVADLPGVEEKDLDVRVDKGILTIQARSAHAVSGDPIYREYELLNFFRQFQLSDDVDQSKISGKLKYGVLTLNLPKAEEVIPRKIEIMID